MRRATIAGVILGLGLGSTVHAQQVVGGCPVLPSNNIWNTPVDTLPVLSSSSAMVNTIGASRGFHADFGSGTWDGGPIGIPFVTVNSAQPSYPASFRWPGESDAGPYAIPLNAPIEGGANATGDRHALAVDTERCVLYELYRAFPQSASWVADSGSIFDLKSNALRPSTWTSADAAGLPIMPGLVTYEEVVSGEIKHAIRFTAPETRREFVWPARHYASSLTGSQYPRMGERFRLKASFDVTPYPSDVQVILRAMKKYGIILADNGSAWYLSGKPDSRWNNDHLQTFGQLLGANLEAVDATVLMIDPNSGRARQLPEDLLVDFGTAYGVWTLYDGAAWAQLHSISPENMITGDLDGNGVDDVVIDFGSVHGLWVHLNNASWVQLHVLSPTAMVTADLDHNGKDDVVINFPGFGIFIWYNNTTWTKLHPLESGLMAAGNIDGAGGDDVIIDFPGKGVWVFLNNSSWFQLHALNATAIVTGDLDGSGRDDVVIDFPGWGIWQFVNNASWSRLHALDAPRFVIGDIDGNFRDDLIVDFGAQFGIWVLRNGAWSQLHTLPSEGLVVGDLDGDGRAEIVVDFGASLGLWAWFNNSFWKQLHSVSPKNLQTGELNRRP
jgi:hypothetical protein